MAVHRRRRDAAGELGAEPLLDVLGVERDEPVVAERGQDVQVEVPAIRLERGRRQRQRRRRGTPRTTPGVRSPTRAGRSSRHGPCRLRPRGRSGRRRPCGGTSWSVDGPIGSRIADPVLAVALLDRRHRDLLSGHIWDTRGRRLGTKWRSTPVTSGHWRSNGKQPSEQVVYPLNGWRRRRESNPGTGLCRPLPQPLGHVARWRRGRHWCSHDSGAGESSFWARIVSKSATDRAQMPGWHESRPDGGAVADLRHGVQLDGVGRPRRRRAHHGAAELAARRRGLEVDPRCQSPGMSSAMWSVSRSG